MSNIRSFIKLWIVRALPMSSTPFSIVSLSRVISFRVQIDTLEITITQNRMIPVTQIIFVLIFTR